MGSQALVVSLAEGKGRDERVTVTIGSSAARATVKYSFSNKIRSALTFKRFNTSQGKQGGNQGAPRRPQRAYLRRPLSVAGDPASRQRSLRPSFTHHSV